MCSPRNLENTTATFAVLFTLCGIILGFLYLFGVNSFIAKDIFAGITFITFSVTGVFALLGSVFVLFLSLCFYCCKTRGKRVQPILETVVINIV